MNLYERHFRTDWDTIDVDAATEHAYAIGVAEQLGTDNRDHLVRIYDAMGVAYEKTIIELAYEEGRREAAAVDERGSAEETWAALVEDRPIEIDPDELPIGGRDGLPEALEPADALDRTDVDSRDALDRPGFLDR